MYIYLHYADISLFRTDIVFFFRYIHASFITWRSKTYLFHLYTKSLFINFSETHIDTYQNLIHSLSIQALI